MEKQKVIFRDMGHMPYKEAWEYQERLLKENVEIKSKVQNRKSEMMIAGSDDSILPTSDFRFPTSNYLLFVEHPPVYTLGKSGNEANVLMNEQQLSANGIEFFHTNRGGDITFHGLQQVVGYPIIDLENFYTDIGRYLRELEEVIILTMAEYGLKGERSKGETGVWIDPDIKGKERKICAMGIRCSRWITMHGFAFNVNTDLSYFNNIIPCGIQNKQVTSLKNELGREVDMEEVKEKLRNNFSKVFNVDIIL